MQLHTLRTLAVMSGWGACRAVALSLPSALALYLVLSRIAALRKRGHGLAAKPAEHGYVRVRSTHTSRTSLTERSTVIGLNEKALAVRKLSLAGLPRFAVRCATLATLVRGGQ